MSWLSFRALVFSLLLHAIIAGLLIMNIRITPEPLRPVRPVSIVNAVTVDEKQVNAEIKRIKDSETKKQKELEQKLRDLQQQTSRIEDARKKEELRLADARKKKEQEEKLRVDEQKKLADLKKQQAEVERKRKEDEAERKRKAEEEKQRLLAEQKKKEEEERKKREDEARRQELAEEQRQLEAAQALQDRDIINQYAARIQAAIGREFNLTGLSQGLSCVIFIRMIPGGDVIEARVVTSSGDSIFDRRAEVAVQKAAPLPVPDDQRLFEKFRTINFNFKPQPNQN